MYWVRYSLLKHKHNKMKKNLLLISFLTISIPVSAQVLMNVNKDAVVFVAENTLVYSGGGLQTFGTGLFDVRGNVMIQGSASDVFKTLNAAGTAAKSDGGNFILRLNNPANHSSTSSPSTYGQLHIQGLTQGANLTAVVDKEFRTSKHGTYQQIALPFYNKVISSLSGATNAIGTFGKTFSNSRYSQDEVLTWNNATVVSANLPVTSLTPKSTAYYMFGSKNFDSGNPPAAMPANAPVANGSVYTVKGVPIANGVNELLKDAALGVNFGVGGNARNVYNERYSSYLQDNWDFSTNLWTGTFGRNMYQFGNPYLTNLDLGMIGIVEAGTTTDNNALSAIQGIRYDPGTVQSTPGGATYSTGAKFINFTSGSPVPVGDVGLIIKPMQTFVIKMRDNAAESGGNRTLSFDNLRRFKNTPRTSGNYSVNARSLGGSVKQLGVIALDEFGEEMSRTYYAVYPTAVSGHTTDATTQSTLGSDNIIGTFEENATTGGIDPAFSNAYWLYINEANETNFTGKAVPLALYSTGIKSLKFEIRENTELLNDGTHALSTGIGFYFRDINGVESEIFQNQIVPVTGDQYSLYYGKPQQVLGAGGAVKPSRTMVVFNRAADAYVVRFDPAWKRATVDVYDLSGKLVISGKDVSTTEDFRLDLSKNSSGYVVTAVSETGEKMSSKIVR